MSTAFKTSAQVEALAKKHGMVVEEVPRAPNATFHDYRITLEGAFVFQGDRWRCGDFLEGYDRAKQS